MWGGGSARGPMSKEQFLQVNILGATAVLSGAGGLCMYNVTQSARAEWFKSRTVGSSFHLPAEHRVSLLYLKVAALLFLTLS